VPASSGKITRHRLSRGGDRAANNALYRIALVRMSAHPQTRDYVEHQLAKGRTKKEILRLLKRAIAREIFRLLTRPTPIYDYRDLRRARQAKTSPWPPSPPTSASRSSPSRDSNVDTNATTPWPTTTANGSPPFDT
jgi:Transposase IS116/IS110/IS902 family